MFKYREKYELNFVLSPNSNKNFCNYLSIKKYAHWPHSIITDNVRLRFISYSILETWTQISLLWIIYNISIILLHTAMCTRTRSHEWKTDLPLNPYLEIYYTTHRCTVHIILIVRLEFYHNHRHYNYSYNLCTFALLCRQLADRLNDEPAWLVTRSNGSWCDAAPPMIFGLNSNFREKIFLNDNGISHRANCRRRARASRALNETPHHHHHRRRREDDGENESRFEYVRRHLSDERRLRTTCAKIRRQNPKYELEIRSLW